MHAEEIISGFQNHAPIIVPEVVQVPRWGVGLFYIVRMQSWRVALFDVKQVELL